MRENDARATFFLIGERIHGNEAIVRRMVEEGHEIGNQLWRDQPSIELPPGEFAQQLERTHASLAPFSRDPTRSRGGRYLFFALKRSASLRCISAAP